MNDILIAYCLVTGFTFLFAIIFRVMETHEKERKWLARFILTAPFWPVWLVAGLYCWFKEVWEDAK